MYFDDPTELSEIARRSGTVIFAVTDIELGLKNTIHIRPAADKNHLSIEQVREVIAATTSKQATDQFFIFHQAETLSQEAANALLKLLEEPSPGYHFILLTTEPHLLLPTILSRASLFFPRQTNQLSIPPATSPEILKLSKELLVASPRELATITDLVHKKKDNARGYALDLLATTIELAYKSYFATGRSQFLTKIPGLLLAHHHIKAGGNLRLQLFANLC